MVLNRRNSTGKYIFISYEEPLNKVNIFPIILIYVQRPKNYSEYN